MKITMRDTDPEQDLGGKDTDARLAFRPDAGNSDTVIYLTEDAVMELEHAIVAWMYERWVAARGRG